MTVAKKPAAKPEPKQQAAAPKRKRVNKPRQIVQEKPGRPTTYTRAIGIALCDLIMTPMSLTEACLQEDMPDKRQVFRWRDLNAEFREMYDSAKLASMDLYVDETIYIADEVKPDAACIAKAKLQIDSRWKSAERVAPKKYGPKNDANITLVSHESWLEQLK